MKASELTDIAAAWLRGQYPNAHILREFSVSEYGGGLVDLAAILPDRIVGVEVKGEGDSPSRLGLQGGMYSRVCRSMWLLATPGLFERCGKHLPHSWGQLSIEPQDKYRWKNTHGLWSKAHFQQENGYGLSPVALAALPWTKEYPRFSCEIGWSVPRTKSDCIRAVANNEPLPRIEAAVCRTLRFRDWEYKTVDLPGTGAESPREGAHTKPMQEALFR